MTCCAPGIEASAEGVLSPEHDEATLYSAARDLGNGQRQLDFSVPDMHCAACIATVEKALTALPAVIEARVNFSTRRARVTIREGTKSLADISRAIEAAGYRVFLPDPTQSAGSDGTLSSLTRALAVAGFAAGNIMLFSVSIWSGAEPVTRDMFHWISALIAVPAVAYAGQPFFRSAWRALHSGNLNMDVPISLAVLLALALSLFETVTHGQHAYFDASVSLLFFLLIGRTLDHLMREKARGAVRDLARLAPRDATVLYAGGRRERLASSEIAAGMIIEIAPGERVPVDCEVVNGQSDVDMSLVTGESLPEFAGSGTTLLTGATNLSGRLIVRALRPAAQSFIARMISLMEAAEGSKAGYKRIADRASAIYAPAVHLLSLATFIGWMIVTGEWHQATTNAIAVLIVTCPCALALAVPIVHVVASGRLFESGIMMRDGAALERLAIIDRVVFDKTGTLTAGRPRFVGQLIGDEKHLKLAATVARASRHPLSQSLAATMPDAPALPGTAKEFPGNGVEYLSNGTVWHLGRAEYCGVADTDKDARSNADASMVYLSRNGFTKAAFAFADAARPDAAATIRSLENLHLAVTLLSGDRPGPVTALAGELDIHDARDSQTPDLKLEFVTALSSQGHHVLMVGDGINDAPALRAADVSMAPSSAADIGRNAADFVFTRPSLSAVPFAIRLARAAALKVKQNFALAIAYNIIAVPLAVTGHVTPLVAALAMSSSSIFVTLNALTLRFGSRAASVPANPSTQKVRLAAAE